MSASLVPCHVVVSRHVTSCHQTSATLVPDGSGPVTLLDSRSVKDVIQQLLELSDNVSADQVTALATAMQDAAAAAAAAATDTPGDSGLNAVSRQTRHSPVLTALFQRLYQGTDLKVQNRSVHKPCTEHFCILIYGHFTFSIILVVYLYVCGYI